MAPSRPLAVGLRELDRQQASTYLFPLPADVWHARQGRKGGDPVEVHALDASDRRLRRSSAAIPAAFVESHPFQSLLGVALDFRSEWEDRIYLFDPQARHRPGPAPVAHPRRPGGPGHLQRLPARPAAGAGGGDRARAGRARAARRRHPVPDRPGDAPRGPSPAGGRPAGAAGRAARPHPGPAAGRDPQPARPDAADEAAGAGPAAAAGVPGRPRRAVPPRDGHRRPLRLRARGDPLAPAGVRGAGADRPGSAGQRAQAQRRPQRPGPGDRRRTGDWKVVIDDDGRGFPFSGRLGSGGARRLARGPRGHQGAGALDRRPAHDRVLARARGAAGDRRSRGRPMPEAARPRSGS